MSEYEKTLKRNLIGKTQELNLKEISDMSSMISNPMPLDFEAFVRYEMRVKYNLTEYEDKNIKDREIKINTLRFRKPYEGKKLKEISVEDAFLDWNKIEKFDFEKVSFSVKFLQNQSNKSFSYNSLYSTYNTKFGTKELLIQVNRDLVKFNFPLQGEYSNFKVETLNRTFFFLFDRKFMKLIISLDEIEYIPPMEKFFPLYDLTEKDQANKEDKCEENNNTLKFYFNFETREMIDVMTQSNKYWIKFIMTKNNNDFKAEIKSNKSKGKSKQIDHVFQSCTNGKYISFSLGEFIFKLILNDQREFDDITYNTEKINIFEMKSFSFDSKFENKSENEFDIKENTIFITEIKSNIRDLSTALKQTLTQLTILKKTFIYQTEIVSFIFIGEPKKSDYLLNDEQKGLIKKIENITNTRLFIFKVPLYKKFLKFIFSYTPKAHFDSSILDDCIKKYKNELISYKNQNQTLFNEKFETMKREISESMKGMSESLKKDISESLKKDISESLKKDISESMKGMSESLKKDISETMKGMSESLKKDMLFFGLVMILTIMTLNLINFSARNSN